MTLPWLRAALLAAFAAQLSVAVPLSAHASPSQPVLAVFDIEDRGVGLSTEKLRRLSDFLAMRLAATGAYQIVPRDQLKKRLAQQKRQSYKQCYERSCQIEVGRELAAQKSLSTMVMKLGTKCMVTAVLFDLRRAASMGGASAEGGCSEDQVVASITTVVNKLVPRSQVGAPKAAKPAKRGGLLIKTRPAGASVLLDGVEVKGQTPLTITGLAAGQHLLELRKGDYRYAGKAKVTADRYRTVSIILKKARVKLEVVSDPPEATIRLNGADMGKTPKILADVKAGTHVVELTKLGYLSVRKQLRIGAGTARQTVRVTLEEGARLSVHSDPPGAAISLGGAAKGKTPAELLVRPGVYRLELTATDREPQVRVVRATVGKQTKVRLALKLTAAAVARQRAQAEAEARRLAAAKALDQRAAPLRARRRSKSIWGYTLVATGVALAAGGGALVGLGASQGGEAHDAYTALAGEQAPADEDLEALDGHRSDVAAANTKVAVGAVLLVGAAASLGYGLYQLLTRPEVSVGAVSGADGISVGLVPLARGASVGISGRFGR